MRCPYCNVEYTAGESCFCHAPMEAKTASTDGQHVRTPWGEAERAWTEPTRPGKRVMK